MPRVDYKARMPLEKFGEKIFNLLVENFPQTFYVGGMVRDILMHLKVTDIDITTKAEPDEVVKILANAGVIADTKYKQFGVIVAKDKNYSVEIATFRKDTYSTGRYPKISFVKSAKIDSQRRDFTINALYLSSKSGKILDFHNGLKDLKLKNLKFISNPEKRIKEDPLRIIRALRFAQILNLKLDAATKNAIKNNFSLIKTLTESRAKNELAKIKNANQKKYIQKLIDKQIFA
jgi:tRNA nucleotidyltransferase/poly(A) polymerase